MSALKHGVRLLAVVSLAGLAACGGGGSSDTPQTNTNTNSGAAPSTDTTASAPAASDLAVGNLQVTAAGGTDNTVVVQTYPVDTNNAGAAASVIPLGTDQLEMVTLVSTSTDSPKPFDSIFSFLQGTPGKYYFTFFDNKSKSFDAYECMGGSWSPAELQQLKLASAPVTCSGAVVTTNTATHTVKFTGLKLVARGAPSKSITVSGNLQWAAPASAVMPAATSGGAAADQ